MRSIGVLLLALSACARPGPRQSLPGCPEACSCFVRTDRLHADCAHRGLAALPPDINPYVHVLDLSNNLFEEYPPELQNLSELESLNLAGNQLSAQLPEYFENFSNLVNLNLSRNKYDDWDKSFRHSAVQTLDLSRNFINKLHYSSFSYMPDLQYLDLSENRLTALPVGVFDELQNLETLIMSRNYLDQVPRFQSSSLRKIDLSMCLITSLRYDSFIGKTALEEVDLSTNQIDSIPDHLRSDTIKKLDLSYNSIETINSSTFQALPGLEVLSLSGNDFEDIWTPGYFSANKYLREVHVTGNRWRCDGFGVNLLLMYDFLTRDSRVPDSSALICYSPGNVTGWTWQRAYVVTWHIEDTGDDSFKYASVLTGVVIGVMLTACLCSISMRKKIRELEESRGSSRPQTRNGSTANSTVRGRNAAETRVTIETVDIRIPLHPEPLDDLPPTYDEALLMPRLDGSFHSLPDYLGPRTSALGTTEARISRSINDLLDEGSSSPTDARHSRIARSSRRSISAQLAQALSQ